MKEINAFQLIPIPEGCEVSVKQREVTVKGKRGTLTRSFKHLCIDIYVLKESNEIKVEKWFGKKREIAAVRTICSHISNMFKGVTYGFQYKMRAVYAHFPINCAISEQGSLIEIRNFLGEKFIRRVKMEEGVTVQSSKAMKDQLILEGNSIEDVSKSAAQIQRSTTVKNKDIRKFLDGIYVSAKGPTNHLKHI